MNCLALLLAVALSSGNAEFDEAARNGAYEISVRRIVSDTASRGPRAGRLAEAMLADPSKYANAEASRALAKEKFLALAAEEAEAERRKVAERLGMESGAALPELSGADAESAERAFDLKYAAERRQACESQAKTIVSATRPTVAEVDALSDQELCDLMSGRIAAEQATPVFDENREYISKSMVRPVVESARAEQRRQREYLMRAKSDAVAPSRLSADLEARLRGNVAARMKADASGTSWDVFPSVVSSAIPEAVERRTVDLLATEVEGVRLDVSADEVMKTIAADPQAHARRSDSEKRFFSAYSSGALAEALAKAVAAAPEADRGELEGYLRRRLGSEKVVKAVERLVRRDVMPKWSQARQEAARRVAASTWPALEDGTWHPGPELADEVAARSDYSAAVREWRKAKGMESLAAASGGRAMEEAESMADAAVARAFDLARGAIAAQNAIVDGCHGQVLAESRARKDSFWRRTPDLKAVTEMLLRATESRWEEVRLATLWPDGRKPANASEQHRAIFPSVRRKIELLAKTILEEMNEPSPERREEEVEVRSESLPDEAPALLLSVSRSGDRVEVKLERNGDTIGSESVPARAGDFDQAMRRMTRILSSDVLRLK